MTLALFGGSFDPPHVAHVLAAHYVLSVGLADRVLILPVFQHALGKQLSPYGTRLEMCRAAFSHDARLEVSELESTLPAPSYTLHSILAVKALFPEQPLRLVVGSDILSETKHWHRFAEVENLAPLIVLGRAGMNHENAPPAVLPSVSSTQARQWCSEQNNEESRTNRERLIPLAVRNIIERERLYRSPT